MMKMKKRFNKTPSSSQDKVNEGVGVWTSFYREHPHRFAKEYLGMSWMTRVQQLLLNIILSFTYSMIIASRGFGKTMIVAAAICVKAILYPGVEIVIAAGNRSQSINVINKIIEIFMPASQNLQNEISAWKSTQAEAYVKFHNGSIVKVVTARDSARSARANWVICDEFVQIKKTVIDSVLRKFKAGQRRPGFYDIPKYKDHPKEVNTETYISSAHYKYHYSWNRFKAFFKSMIKGENYVCMGFPYQLPVSEGYYPVEQIREEMQEDDFNSIKFSMEMDSLFFGENSNAFYSYTDLEINRVLDIPVYPPGFYAVLGDPKFKYKPSENGEIRLIAMDIATQGGSKNDNTCYVVYSLKPNDSLQYERSIIYIEVLNGGHTEDQAIRLRQLFEDFEGDFVAIDTMGVGIGVFDCLVRELVDEERGKVYAPWTCVNDASMAERCKDPDAKPVIYSIKATAQMNNDMAVGFRDCLKRGKVRLLVSEIDGQETLLKNKYYNKLPEEDKVMFQLPFYNTTMLINETINLSYEVVGGKIKVSEPAGMRKDRYSAASMGNYVASFLERDILRPRSNINVLSGFQFRQPKIRK